jgi:hypothetical protein
MERGQIVHVYGIHCLALAASATISKERKRAA